MASKKQTLQRGQEVLWSGAIDPKSIWFIDGFGGVNGVFIFQDDALANVTRDSLSSAPRDPYRIALRQILGCAPPWWFRGSPSALGDDFAELQDWISCNLPEALVWSTAIAIIDSIECIVMEATGNGNIKIDENGGLIHLNG
jgi:hypothetical protein